MRLRKSAYGDEVCVRHVTEGMWGQECVYCAVVLMTKLFRYNIRGAN